MKHQNSPSGNATKGDLLLFKGELKQEMGELEQRLDGKFQKYRDEVLTRLDDISGQLENLQEDKTLSIHQASQLREEVENHEKRIKHLEKIQQVA